MDPDEALRQIRDAIASIARRYGENDDETRLADSFGALDQWLSGGGFLPREWANGSGEV